MNIRADLHQIEAVAASRPHWERQASGYSCGLQVVYSFEGEVWRRDCGHCPRCLARKKRDVAGRAGAEALTAAQVVVWTLTYRDGNPGAVDFVTKDRQDFLKRLRDWLLRKARREVGAPKRMPRGAADHVRAYWKARIAEVLPKVRYMGCGERGKRSTKRCHWHLILFLSKPSGLRSTPEERPGKPGRELHSLWPYGFVNVDVLPQDMGRKMQAVRYCVKYVNKSMSPKIDGLRRGDKAEAKFFRSNATPLGFEYLTDEARRYADAGLPFAGKYRVPGVRFSRTRPGGGDGLTVHQLTGRMRDHAIAAYRQRWQETRPHIPVPMTPWMLRYDNDAVSSVVADQRRARLGVKPRGVVVPKAPDRGTVDQVHMPVYGSGRDRGTVRGWVSLDWQGEATWTDEEAVEHPIPGRVSDTVPGLTDRQADWLQHKIDLARGPGWISERQRRQLAHDRARAQRDALKPFAKRGPNPMPAHLPPMEPVTGLLRKLAMMGDGPIPGTVSTTVWAGIKQEAFVSSGPSRPKKSLHSREV